jgi:hypothetical protein
VRFAGNWLFLSNIKREGDFVLHNVGGSGKQRVLLPNVNSAEERLLDGGRLASFVQENANGKV